MQLTDFLFLFAFLPAALICAALTGNRPHARNALLLAMSVLFCAASGLPGLLAAAIEILAAFFFGRALERAGEPKRRKCILALGIVFAAGLLCYFKYTNFILQTLRLPKVSVLPAPVGVSFLTFLLISYLADVYRGRIPAETRFSRFFLYALYFPKAAQGPLCRYGDFSAQLDGCTQDAALPDEGVSRLILGLGKKVLLSGAAGAVAKDAFGLPAASLTPVYAWAGAICYAMQLYFDFSGYTDMALGLSLCFGIRLPENFNSPYLAVSVTDFWRRWHISLSGWFRDYVYIPLGGSRVAAKRRLYFNIFMVWLLTGIWHGAKWTYIVWGMMYFVLLCVERILNLSGQKSWLGWIYTVFFFIAGNVVFRSENVTGALKYLLAMFNIHTTGLLDEKAVYYFAEYKMFLLIGMAAALPIAVWLRAQVGRRGAWIENLRPVWCAAVFLVALSFIVKGGYNPFIYFDF